MGQTASTEEVASKMAGLGESGAYACVASAVLKFDLSGAFLLEAPGDEIEDFLVSRCPSLLSVQRRRVLFELDCAKRRDKARRVAWHASSEESDVSDDDDVLPRLHGTQREALPQEASSFGALNNKLTTTTTTTRDARDKAKERSAQQQQHPTPKLTASSEQELVILEEAWRTEGSKYLGLSVEREVWDDLGRSKQTRRGVIVAWCEASTFPAAAETSLLQAPCCFPGGIALWRAAFNSVREPVELDEAEVVAGVDAYEVSVIKEARRVARTRDATRCRDGRGASSRQRVADTGFAVVRSDHPGGGKRRPATPNGSCRATSGATTTKKPARDDDDDDDDDDDKAEALRRSTTSSSSSAVRKVCGGRLEDDDKGAAAHNGGKERKMSKRQRGLGPPLTAQDQRKGPTAAVVVDASRPSKPADTVRLRQFFLAGSSTDPASCRNKGLALEPLLGQGRVATRSSSTSTLVDAAPQNKQADDHGKPLSTTGVDPLLSAERTVLSSEQTTTSESQGVNNRRKRGRPRKGGNSATSLVQAAAASSPPDATTEEDETEDAKQRRLVSFSSSEETTPARESATVFVESALQECDWSPPDFGDALLDELTARALQKPALFDDAVDAEPCGDLLFLAADERPYEDAKEPRKPTEPSSAPPEKEPPASSVLGKTRGGTRPAKARPPTQPMSSSRPRRASAGRRTWRENREKQPEVEAESDRPTRVRFFEQPDAVNATGERRLDAADLMKEDEPTRAYAGALLEPPAGDVDAGSTITDADGRDWYVCRDGETLFRVCSEHGLDAAKALRVHVDRVAPFCCFSSDTAGLVSSSSQQQHHGKRAQPKLALRSKLKHKTRVLLTF